MLVGDSQKKFEAVSMLALYLGIVLDNLIKSKIPSPSMSAAEGIGLHFSTPELEEPCFEVKCRREMKKVGCKIVSEPENIRKLKTFQEKSLLA